MRSLLVAAVLFVFLSGCSPEKHDDSKKTELTRQEKDSVLSESGLPGSGVVREAIAVSDSASARAKRTDAEAR